MLTTSFHPTASAKPPLAKADRADSGAVWVKFVDGDDNEVAIFLPKHPDAYAAAQTMALAFNRLVPTARKAV